MNTLTVNLHLMLASFYRPTRRAAAHRHRGRGLPLGQLRGAEPRRATTGSTRPTRSCACGRARARTRCAPRTSWSRSSARASGIALVLLGGVNYLTGQLVDIAGDHRGRARARAPSRAGTSRTPPATCRCSCTTGTSTSPPGARTSTSTPGPGAVAGCFVHERHGRDTTLPRFAGWWGNDPATRFQMQPELRAARRAPTAGSSRTRRSSRWRRCAPRWSCSTASACRRCASARCGSRATWSRCSTRSSPPAPSRQLTPRDPERARLPALAARRRRRGRRCSQRAAPRARRRRRRPRAGRRALRAGAALLHLPRLLARRRRARDACSPAGR